jgi:hypothetical protein
VFAPIDLAEQFGEHGVVDCQVYHRDAYGILQGEW